MLFADKPTTFVIPFGGASLFFKFFLFRNTDKPNWDGQVMLEFKVIKNEEEVFSENYHLKDLFFIDTRTLDSFLSFLSKKGGSEGYGENKINCINYVFDILPNVCLHLGNSINAYSDQLEISAYWNMTLALTDEIELNDKKILQEDYSLTRFVKSIREYNNHLMILLKEQNLWAQYCDKQCIDPDYWTLE